MKSLGKLAELGINYNLPDMVRLAVIPRGIIDIYTKSGFARYPPVSGHFSPGEVVSNDFVWAKIS